MLFREFTKYFAPYKLFSRQKFVYMTFFSYFCHTKYRLVLKT